jgi:hypothetical protein
MKTVKRIEKGTVLDFTEINIAGIKGFGHKVNCTSYAVVDEAGAIMKDSRGNWEVFPLKKAAQLEANYYNRMG